MAILRVSGPCGRRVCLLSNAPSGSSPTDCPPCDESPRANEPFAFYKEVRSAASLISNARKWRTWRTRQRILPTATAKCCNGPTTAASAETPHFAIWQGARRKVEALFAELKNCIGLRRLAAAQDALHTRTVLLGGHSSIQG